MTHSARAAQSTYCELRCEVAPHRCHTSGSLAEVPGRLEPEVFAQYSDVVPVDLTQLVSGVVLQGELGTLASNRDTSEPTFAGKILAGEQERRVETAIVEPAVAQSLVEVKVYATTVPVVQDEIPGAVAGPGVDPIDSLAGEGCDQTFEVSRIHPDVEIQMLPGLFPDQRVDSPTSADAHGDSVLLQGSDQAARLFRRHRVVAHASASQATQLH